MLLEPWLGKEGKVIDEKTDACGATRPAQPYSYSWDYAAMFAGADAEGKLTVTPKPLNAGRWGPYYHLYQWEMNVPSTR
jgi:hypothetical protein